MTSTNKRTAEQANISDVNPKQKIPVFTSFKQLHDAHENSASAKHLQNQIAGVKKQIERLEESLKYMADHKKDVETHGKTRVQAAYKKQQDNTYIMLTDKKLVLRRLQAELVMLPINKTIEYMKQIFGFGVSSK